MGFFSVQSTFARGEVSPEVARRDETDIYYASAKELTNVLSVPQGGLTRRPGLAYKATLQGKARLAPFEFNVDQTYIVAFSDSRIQVFQDGVEVALLGSPYTEAEIFDAQHPLRWAQQADTMFVVHENHAPRRVVRFVPGSGALATDAMTTTLGSATIVINDPNHNVRSDQIVVISGAPDVNGIPGSEINAPAGHAATRIDHDNFSITVTTTATSSGSGGGSNVTWVALETWKLATVEFSKIPQRDFDDALTPDVTNEIQILEFLGTWSASDRYRLDFGGQKTPKLDYSDVASENADRIRDALQALPNTAGADSVEVTAAGADPDGPFTIEFVGEDGNKNVPPITGIVVKNTSGGTIAVDFNGAGSSVQGASGTEDAWSALRGWPRVVGLYEQRLFLANTPFLPSSLWGSVTGLPFDFEVGDALDDEAIDHDAAADRLDEITHVLGLRNLVVLTSGGEFYSEETPVTPTNIALRRDTARGSSMVRPVLLDGSVLFLQRDRTAIRQFLFADFEQAYSADDITILSRHMLVSPVDQDAEQAALGDYVYLVNADGTMAVLNMNRQQGILAWTRARTRDGDSIQSVAVIHGDEQRHEVYCAVERSINGATVHYLERLEASAFMDSQLRLTGSGLTTWTGLDHLEGETVMLKLDGEPLFETAVAGGQVTTPAGDVLEVGFNSSLPIVETLPVVVDSRSGRTTMRQKKIHRATVDMLDSADVWVGKGGQDPVNVDPPFFGFGAPPTFTAQREERFLGWEATPTVRVTQTKPLPFTLRALELELQINA